jgi:HK97 family phage major capsid protein
LRAFFEDRFGRALNTACTTDDGSSKPQGVVTASTLGKTAASATAITFSEILDLIHSIDPAYRASQRFGLMFHDATLAYLKKLSIGSSDARPLWQPSFVEGAPDKIDGYRYWINQDMDSSINAASKLILAGDFNKYVIRLVQDLQYARLDELFSMNGLVGFQGYMSFDGELMNTSAIKHLITAAS